MDHKNTKIDNSPNTDSFFFDLQRKEGLYRNISELKKEFNNKLNIFLENQKQNEELNEIADFNIFMAMIDHIGHDKRGNTVYKRDEEGNLIMEHKKVSVREINEQGKASYHEEEFDEKIINDQTILVADVFSNWKKEQGIIW